MPHPAFPFLFAPLLASSSPTPAPQAPAAPTNDLSLAAMNQAAKEAEHPKKEYIDYGWQIWIANATILIPFLGLFTTKNSNLQEKYLQAAVAFYFIPPAAVHFANGQFANGLASGGLRAGGIYGGIIPALLFCVGGSDVSASSEKSPCYSGTVSILAGIATAATADAVFLAKKEVPAHKSSVRLAPSFGWSADRPSFSLSGSW